MQLTISRGYKTKDSNNNEVSICFTGAVGYTILPDDYFSLIYMSGIIGTVMKLTPTISSEMKSHFR